MEKAEHGISEIDIRFSGNKKIKETVKPDCTNSRQGSAHFQQKKINPATEVDRKKDCIRISNDEIIDLFFSISEEFSKAQSEAVKNEVENISDKREKLHAIICSQLRFPKGSVLKGNFTNSSFRIDIVEDSDRDMIQKKCDSNNLTLEYVLDAYKKLNGMNTQKKIGKLHRDLCKKVGVDEVMVDKYSVELKIKSKESNLKRLRKNGENKKIETMMKSVFYLPVKRKDLLKDLQNLQENSKLYFLQNHDTELINGLLVDVFEAVKGNRIQLRKVLCCRFTKLCCVKAKTLNEKVNEVLNEAEKLKESGKDEELKSYMNLAVFETVYSVMPPLQETQKETEEDPGPNEHCVGMENESVCKSSSVDRPARTRKKPNSKVDTTFIELEDGIEDDQFSDIEEDEDLDDQASKKHKRQAYDNAFKLRVVQFAEKESNRATAKRFNISEGHVRSWKKAKAVLQERPKNMRKNFSRAKELSVLENDLCNWFMYYQQNGTVLGKREIMLKAKLLAKEPKYKINTGKHLFGKTWCNGFLKTYNLTLCRNKRKAEKELTTDIDFNTRKSKSLKREKCGSYSDDSDDDLSFCGEVYLDVDEVNSDEAGAKSNTSKLVVDEKTVPNAIECRVELDMRRESPRSETDKSSLRSNSISESEVAGVNSKTKDINFSNPEQNRTEFGKKCSNTEDNVRSKGRKRKHAEFDNAFKQFAEESGTKVTAEKYGINEDDIQEWCDSKTLTEQNSETLNEEKSKCKRKTRNLTDLEKDLLSWVQDMLNSGSEISPRLVATKARSLRDEGKYDIDPFEWKFSNEWAKRFLKRNGLILDKEDVSDKKDAVKNYVGGDLDTDISPELFGVPYQSGDNSEITDLEKTSGKAFRRQSYDNVFKRNVISFAESSSNRFAERVFKINESVVRSWRKSKECILNRPDGRKRYGYENMATFKELENDLVSWCQNLLKNGGEITRSTLMFKAKQLARKRTYSEDTSQFKASEGWCNRFLDRHDLLSTVVDGRSRKKPQHRKQISELHTSIIAEDNESCESTETT